MRWATSGEDFPKSRCHHSFALLDLVQLDINRFPPTNRQKVPVFSPPSRDALVVPNRQSSTPTQQEVRRRSHSPPKYHLFFTHREPEETDRDYRSRAKNSRAKNRAKFHRQIRR